MRRILKLHTKSNATYFSRVAFSELLKHWSVAAVPVRFFRIWRSFFYFGLKPIPTRGMGLMCCSRFGRLPFPKPAGVRRELYLMQRCRGFPSARMVAVDLRGNVATKPPSSSGLGFIRWGGRLAPVKRQRRYTGLETLPLAAAPLSVSGRGG